MGKPPERPPFSPAGLLARARSLLRGVFRRSRVEAEMLEEFRAHVDLRTEHLVRQGLSWNEASRQAHREFGHAETHRNAARAARGLRVFDHIRFSWIDVKLGGRMLVKHPWLTLVAVMALAIGIPVGLAPMHVANAIEAPLPEDPGNRVRALRYWDPATTTATLATYEDFEYGSGRLSTFSALGAFRSGSYNVASEDGRGTPVTGAQMTASSFEILATAPLMGRVLGTADEAPGALAVALIGHDLWRARFAADPAIVGKTIRVGSKLRTVVGVMPQGFLFPLTQQLWLPLPRESAAAGGSGVRIFGRLAAGADAEAAQSELSAVGRPPTPASSDESRARLRPEVVPFGMLFLSVPRGGLDAEPGFYFFQLLALALLLVACGNVAMLVFARTATRFRELAVRTALGASRARIVTQMFVETVLLAVVGAGAGVFSVDWLLGRVNLAALAGEPALPYWLRLDVTPEAIVWAFALAIGSAAVAGVVPALRITGKRIQESIQRAEAGRSGIRFGGVTGALIVADVAISVAVVGFAMVLTQRVMDSRTAETLAGIPSEKYVAIQVRVPAVAERDPESPDSERVAATQIALVERLRSEPGVESVVVADALPRMDHRAVPVEVEGIERAEELRGRWVGTARVDIDFFQGLGHHVLVGRPFDAADLETPVRPVIVNTVFVDRILAGQDAVGRRLRILRSAPGTEGPWMEIVGVVGHLGVSMVNPQGAEAMYLPAAPGEIQPMQVGIRVASGPETLAPRLRDIVAEVDPTAVVGSPVVLSDVRQGDWYIMVAIAAGLGLLVGVLVVLAVSGIYAIMSFSVSERTREIGIRRALGAPRQQIVATILRRSLIQIGLGALIGLPIAARVYYEFGGSIPGQTSPIVAALVATSLAAGMVTVVAVLSCLVPTRRVLAVQASEALRAEG